MRLRTTVEAVETLDARPSITARRLDRDLSRLTTGIASKHYILFYILLFNDTYNFSLFIYVFYSILYVSVCM